MLEEAEKLSKCKYSGLVYWSVNEYEKFDDNNIFSLPLTKT
jgi:hypothetical protein